MNQEIISMQTAEKLAEYNKLLLEKRNLIQYLKNQIVLNEKELETLKELKNKERIISSQTRIRMAKEMLYIINKEL